MATQVLTYPSKRSQKLARDVERAKRIARRGVGLTGFEDRVDRTGFCARCHIVMVDSEPCASRPEHYHPTHFSDGEKNTCRYAGTFMDPWNRDLQPFMRKSERRLVKRAGG